MYIISNILWLRWYEKRLSDKICISYTKVDIIALLVKDQSSLSDTHLSIVRRPAVYPSVRR